MHKQQKVMMAGGALAGLASTLLLGPAEALFPSESLAANTDTSPVVAASTKSAQSALPSKSATKTNSNNSTASKSQTSSSATKTSSSKSSSQNSTTNSNSNQSSSAQPSTQKSDTFTGSALIRDGAFGNMKLTVTISNGKITGIDYSSTKVNDNRSYQINSAALPRLVSAALSAQSANVSNISGASYTTMAFREAMQAALTKAGF